MSKNTKRGLLALSLFLVLLPLAAYKPGLPVTLKADEPAYYMMALSLAHDFDLRCETKDIRRGFDEFPYLPANNFILMTDDAWQTTYYGKPFVFSLFAAPLARFFGANGIVSFNMLLLVGMIAMGIRYLRRYNSDGTAALFTIGFFLVSNAFSYTFWLQPELFNMAAGMLCLYLAFMPRPAPGERRGRFVGLRDRLFQDAAMPAWSAAALALAVYNKPMMAALALPVVLVGPARHLGRRTLAFAAGAAIVFSLLCGFSILMTGHPSAYLGVARVGVTLERPDVMPVTPGDQEINRDDPGKNSWSWIYENLPQGIQRENGNSLAVLLEDVRYFLWGRHAGLFPYQLFAWLAVGLFVIHTPRSIQRWWLLAALAAVALFFLLWIPFNWHGGGGFVGNRYFVNVYPGFLFLVTRIRPLWGVFAAYAVGALYLGPMLLTPYGAPVPEPTLQAHTRGTPYRLLPFEFTLRRKIPGYRSSGHSGLGFIARKDAARMDDESMWLQGASSVEIWVTSETPIDSAMFEIFNRAPANVIEIDFAGDRETLRFDAAPPHKKQVILEPRTVEVVHGWEGTPYHLYKMRVDSATGEPTRTGRVQPGTFYLGARVTYLGSPEIHAQDLFKLEWIACELPTEVVAGETFEIPIVFRNRSEFVWPHEGPLRVALSYHWYDEAGHVIVRDGRRSNLRRPLRPGSRMKDKQTVLAPATPGRYELELDPLREKVAWFSERDPGDECRGLVEVLPAPPSDGSEAPSDEPPTYDAEEVPPAAG